MCFGIQEIRHIILTWSTPFMGLGMKLLHTPAAIGVTAGVTGAVPLPPLPALEAFPALPPLRRLASDTARDRKTVKATENFIMKYFL